MRIEIERFRLGTGSLGTKIMVSILTVSLSIVPTCTQAGPYQDDLIRCIGRNLTEPDKVNFAAFVALAMSSLPELEGVVFIDEIRVEGIIEGYAKSIERLYLRDCLPEAKLVVKFEGQSVLAASSRLRTH